MKTLNLVMVLSQLIWVSSHANIIRIPQEFPTIQSGINTANNGDTVLVAEGTYYENINFLGKAITVTSYFLIDGNTSHIGKTIIDGSQPSNSDSASVVYFISGEDTNTVLSGVTITGGKGTIVGFGLVGGGVLCISSRPKLYYVKIQNNIVYSQESGLRKT